MKLGGRVGLITADSFADHPSPRGLLSLLRYCLALHLNVFSRLSAVPVAPPSSPPLSPMTSCRCACGGRAVDRFTVSSCSAFGFRRRRSFSSLLVFRRLRCHLVAHGRSHTTHPSP